MFVVATGMFRETTIMSVVATGMFPGNYHNVRGDYRNVRGGHRDVRSRQCRRRHAIFLPEQPEQPEKIGIIQQKTAEFSG